MSTVRSAFQAAKHAIQNRPLLAKRRSASSALTFIVCSLIALVLLGSIQLAAHSVTRVAIAWCLLFSILLASAVYLGLWLDDTNTEDSEVTYDENDTQWERREVLQQPAVQ